MNPQDREAIEQLFAKLRNVEKQSGPRDGDAEVFIHNKLNEQPAAPYLMAQTIVMQEYALNEAQRRIEQLEQETQKGGGMLSSIFGGGRNRQSSAPMSAAPSPAAGPWGNQPQRSGFGGGGGFLAGAAQTAMGVAGGVLLGNAVMGMFGGEAEAAQPEPEPSEPAPVEEDAGYDDGGFDDEI